MDNDIFIEFEVMAAGEQTIQIIAQGRGVSLFEMNASNLQIDTDEVMPDVVELFVRATNLGMFCGAAWPAQASRGAVVAKRFDAQRQLQTWQVALAGIDEGAFRILMNLLRALDLTRIEVKPLSSSSPLMGAGPWLNYLDLAYPNYHDPTPFGLEISQPLRLSKDRAVQMVFAGEPDERVVEIVYQGFEIWTALLLCGGYPIERTPPRQSGAIPDLAYQHDAYSIVQAFPEYFGCDEASFNAVINWGQILHEKYCPLEQILIS